MAITVMGGASTRARLDAMESMGMSSLCAATKKRSAVQSTMPPRALRTSRPMMTSTPGGVAPTYIKRVSTGAPHWRRTGTSTTVSRAAVPPMPLSHIGEVTLREGQVGSTFAGSIIDTSQNVSGPMVSRDPEGRKPLNTPTLPLAAGPGQPTGEEAECSASETLCVAASASAGTVSHERRIMRTTAMVTL